MAIEDFRAVDTDCPIEADLCLVGSGPAGFAIAEELRDSGLRILILESGGLEPEADAEALDQIECAGVPLFNGRNRILGGTSHTWGGRCLAFDDIDYQGRPWVRFSGWPFGAAAVAPYLDRAGELLGAGPHRADGRRPDGLAAPPAVDPALLRNVCWLFGRDGASSKPIHFGQHLRTRRDATLRILTHATVTHLNIGASGEHLEFDRDCRSARPARDRARACRRAVRGRHRERPHPALFEPRPAGRRRQCARCRRAVPDGPSAGPRPDCALRPARR